MYDTLLTAMIVVGALIIIAVMMQPSKQRMLCQHCQVAVVVTCLQPKGPRICCRDATNYSSPCSNLVYFGIGACLPFFTLKIYQCARPLVTYCTRSFIKIVRN